jgi:Fe-S oxidoreductase
MKRSRANGLCCGAGGAQMFKDAEAGDKEINIERTEDALENRYNCWLSLCNTMLTDGIKIKEKRCKSDGHCRINCKCPRFIEL